MKEQNSLKTIHETLSFMNICSQRRVSKMNIHKHKYHLINGSVGEESTCHAADTRDMGSVHGLGRSPGGENSNPLQYSCLKIPWTEEPGRLQSMGVAKSWTRLSVWLTQYTHTDLERELLSEMTFYLTDLPEQQGKRPMTGWHQNIFIIFYFQKNILSHIVIHFI